MSHGESFECHETLQTMHRTRSKICSLDNRPHELLMKHLNSFEWHGTKSRRNLRVST